MNERKGDVTVAEHGVPFLGEELVRNTTAPGHLTTANPCETLVSTGSSLFQSILSPAKLNE